MLRGMERAGPASSVPGTIMELKATLGLSPAPHMKERLAGTSKIIYYINLKNRETDIEWQCTN